MNVVIDLDLDEIPEGSCSIPAYGDAYSNILACLGYSAEHLPIAEWLKRYYQLQGKWLIVSPIYWEATHNDAVIISGGEHLHLPESEAKAWFTLFSEHFNHLNPIYHTASIWLIQVDDLPLIQAKPLYAMLHQSMLNSILKLDSTLFWQQIITESQMLFNQTQRFENTIPVNGVWIWCDGQLQANLHEKQIVCDPAFTNLANCLFNSVKQLAFTSKELRKSHLFWIKTLEDLSYLQAQLKKHNVNWYWNNGAYMTKPKHWFTRIWM